MSPSAQAPLWRWGEPQCAPPLPGTLLPLTHLLKGMESEVSQKREFLSPDSAPPAGQTPGSEGLKDIDSQPALRTLETGRWDQEGPVGRWEEEK